MKKILFYAAGVIALLVFAPSCEDGRDHPEVIEPLPENAIGFSGSKWGDVPSSRSAGELASAADITQMTVYAHAAGTSNLATSQPNVMLNQLVTRNDKDHPWTYSPIKYWPPNNEKLSFFAITYGPDANNGVSLVTDNGTSYTGYPAFVVTPPTSPSQQKDIGVASALDRTQEDGTVPLSFKHAMAKVKFSAWHKNESATYPSVPYGIVVREIQLSNIYSSATLHLTASGYTWDTPAATKSPYTLSATHGDIVLTGVLMQGQTTNSADAIISTETGTLMLVPQTTPSDATLKITLWTGQNKTLTKTVLLNEQIWNAGEVYTYNLVLSDNDGQSGKLSAVLDQSLWNFAWTDTYQHFVVPQTGTYKLEVWGASGHTSYNVGKGGYSVGRVALNAGDVLYVYVGGTPPSAKVGGYNGGGTTSTATDYGSRAGGGATDIRLGGTTLFHRLIVAGGGGGGTRRYNGTHNFLGGAGGGLSGIDGKAEQTDGRGRGGTQTAGGEGGYGNVILGESGTFGTGGSQTDGRAGAGGGGWYGGGTGGSGYLYVCAGGGGSGWVFTANTYTAWQSGNPTDANQYKVPTTYYLTDATTVAGDVTNGMPNPTATGNMTGNTGHGYARITFLY